MATPVIEIRVNWRNEGFNVIVNDGFEFDTSGWSTAAGIASAATSLTRVTAQHYVGSAAGRVVTTATNGSGVKYDFGTQTFTSGRTYRFRLYAQAVSGTTSAKIIIGSLGTPADRATATMTLTGSWTVYTVDWTPTGTRSDVEAVFANNAASVMTAEIDHVEVFETIDDITGYADSVTWSRGASFDGSAEAPGTCIVTLLNADGRFSPDSTTSPLAGLVVLGRAVWSRSTYGGTTYAHFYGNIRRIVPMPETRKVELVCEDPLYRLSRQEVSVALSNDSSIRSFRGSVLGEAGVFLTNRNLAYGVESDIVYTEADQRSALDVLADLNKATGTVHYIKPHVSSTYLYQYTTVDRATVQGQGIDETFSDDLNGMSNYDLTDEALVNSQRVFPTARRIADVPETVWEGNVPFTIDAGSVTVWAGSKREMVRTRGRATEDITFDDPTFDQELTISGTGISSSTFTPFSRSAKIDISTVSGATVDTLFITGRPARRLSEESVLVEDLSAVSERYAGSDISSDFIASPAMAEGLAKWWVYRYKAGASRPDIQTVNRFPSQLQRDISDRLSITFSLLGISAKQFLIRSLSTTVELQSKLWTTDYQLESTGTALNLFTIGGTAAQGLGGTGVLGY
jgi:hypothetical protein